MLQTQKAAGGVQDNKKMVPNLHIVFCGILNV